MQVFSEKVNHTSTNGFLNILQTESMPKPNHTYTKEAGVYKLTCINNGKIYIGKAVNIKNRLDRHRYCSMKSKGRYYFENSIIKYGWDSFMVEILEIWENFDKTKDNEALLEREAYYITLFDSSNVEIGYNLCKFSTDRTGTKHSEETRKKMGRPCSDVRREKIRQANLGRKSSDKTKKKLRQVHLGRIFTETHKENLKKASPNRVFSEESKLRRDTANSGRKFSKESKEKMRQAKLGKPRAPRTKTGNTSNHLNNI